MSRPAFLIALEPSQGFAARVAGLQVEVRPFAWPAEGDATAARAEAIREALASLAYDGSGLGLGLPSSQVLAAQVLCDNLPRQGRHAALLYRLEEHLPIDAEKLTADFLPAAGGRALGVAVETAPVRGLLDRLAQVGVETEVICPTAFLALWQIARQADTRADYVLLGFADHVDVFRMADSQPVAWYVAPPDAAEVARAVQVDLLTHPADADAGTGLVAGPLEAGFLDAVGAATGVACRQVAESSCVTPAAQATPAALNGEGAGWVNLCRDGLATANRLRRLRRPIGAAVALALVLLAVVSAGAWWRGRLYRAESDRLVEAQQAIFSRLYPNTSVPIGVRRWLASEASRLAGLSGAGETLPKTPAALDALRHVAQGLPTDLRFRLVDLRIEPAEIFLEGQARSHADAEAVARGIAKAGPFTMEPPRTESLVKGGVAFTLAGKQAATPAAPKPKGGQP